MFWKGQESTSPGLAAMARDMLCVAGAGVGIERVFSKSRNVCHYQRGQLSPEAIRAIMITSHNLQQELSNESILAVQETMDVTNMNAAELQEEETQRIEDLENSLKIEYISDDDGDLSKPYKRSPTNIRRRRPAGARQDLFWEDDDTEVVQQSPRQRTAAEMDALYNVPSSPQLHNTTPIQHEPELPQLPRSPSPCLQDQTRSQPPLRIAALTEQDGDLPNSQPPQLQQRRQLIEPVGLARTGRLLFPSEKKRAELISKRRKINPVSAKQDLKAISSQTFYTKG